MCKKSKCLYKNGKVKKGGKPNMIEKVCYQFSKKSLKEFFEDKYIALLYLMFVKYGQEFIIDQCYKDG